MKWVTGERPRIDRPRLLGTAKETGAMETSNG